ncbi:exopolysaccharide biosynthesis protein [Priestia megaterium]|nr:exopolysaccharide biosynthesis protein [Priestia megaterium]
MNIKVMVATHKKYEMPREEMYVPIHVGMQNKKEIGYKGDNTGDNISLKNPNYCELTAMYWGWKNSDADVVGLSHYRRHFCNNSFFIGTTNNKAKSILTNQKAEELLKQYDAILPKKRNYWIETNFSHYAHAHNGNDLLKTREIIQQKYPDYINSFDKVMKKRSAHMFNMLIMKRNIFDSYSEWLFDILFELESNIDISNYSPYEARVFGYISELLLDVWLDVHPIKYIEMPVMFMEKQNWLKKIYEFTKRKFIHS